MQGQLPCIEILQTGVSPLVLEQAMDIYYSSQLAQKIHDGKDDVQYLDYKVLVQILLDTEPELFV